MYYIAIAKGNFGKEMMFWDKKAKAFCNKLPDIKRDAYVSFSATQHKRVKAQQVWREIVDAHVAQGGERDYIRLYTLGESYVEKIQRGEYISL